MKATQIKYRGVATNHAGQACGGSRNIPKGRHLSRNRVWNGPRHKMINGSGKRLARLAFDAQVKAALS